MKAVIFAGGFGTRIAEETAVRPKPMVPVGPQPILWHIMKMYTAYGITDFIICCGYKGDVIKRYFAEYQAMHADVTYDFAKGSTTIHNDRVEPWRVTLVDTGLRTMTGGRLKRVREYVGDETFCLTYGDGVSDVDLRAVVAHHHAAGSHATLTAVQPPGRFGTFTLTPGSDTIRRFREKPADGAAWINGGFFVLEPEVFDYIEGDDTVWEQEPLTQLAHDGELTAYRHTGFWHPMDTLRDNRRLTALWEQGQAPWCVWEPQHDPEAIPSVHQRTQTHVFTHGISNTP